MNRCKGCGKPFRKGKGFHLKRPDGTIFPVIGCQDCAKRALKIVSPIGDAANLCTICETEPARICSGCAVKARMQLVAPVLAQLAALAKVHEANGLDEKADGLRSAMRSLELEAGRG
jgi:hypothetical protein